MCNSLASIAAITYGNFSCNFVVTQVACWETLWSVSHWTTCNSTCLAAMDENSAEEGHYNNITWKRLAGEISLEDTAKPCDNLQGWCYTMQQLGHLSQSRKKPCAMFNWFLLLATIAATKKLWGISMPGYLSLGNFCRATCVAKTLWDKLHKKLPSVTQALQLTIIIVSVSPFFLLLSMDSIYWLKKCCRRKAMVPSGICYKPPA